MTKETKGKTILTGPKIERRGGDHGGGRKPLYNLPLVRFPARLSSDQIELIRFVRPGNLNQGLRDILDDPDVIALIKSKSWK
jgi:hypothetical protein